MSDDLVKMCKRLSKYAHAQLSSTDLERIADRIEELETNLARAVEALQLADATLSGANMNMKVVERKVKNAIAELGKGRTMTQTDDARGPDRVCDWCDETSLQRKARCPVNGCNTRADLATKPDPLADPRVVALVDALYNLHHAVCGETGFAACVRLDSGLAYPWPALDIADSEARAALAAFDTTGGKADDN